MTAVVVTEEIVAVVVTEEIVQVTVSDIGTPGLSAYGLAVINGFVGTEAEWLLSLNIGAPEFSSVAFTPVAPILIFDNTTGQPIANNWTGAGAFFHELTWTAPRDGVLGLVPPRILDAAGNEVDWAESGPSPTYGVSELTVSIGSFNTDPSSAAYVSNSYGRPPVDGAPQNLRVTSGVTYTITFMVYSANPVDPGNPSASYFLDINETLYEMARASLGLGRVLSAADGTLYREDKGAPLAGIDSVGGVQFASYSEILTSDYAALARKALTAGLASVIYTKKPQGWSAGSIPVYVDGSSDPELLASGFDGQFLMADSGVPKGLRYDSLPNASLTARGIVELATTAEATTGTDAVRAVTPAGLKAAINALVNAAPGTLDTLAEIAAALGSDPNFAATMTTALSKRVRFDAAQTLTVPEQAQARANIDAFEFETLPPAPQTLVTVVDNTTGTTFAADWYGDDAFFYDITFTPASDGFFPLVSPDLISGTSADGFYIELFRGSSPALSFDHIAVEGRSSLQALKAGPVTGGVEYTLTIEVYGVSASTSGPPVIDVSPLLDAIAFATLSTRTVGQDGTGSLYLTPSGGTYVAWDHIASVPFGSDVTPGVVQLFDSPGSMPYFAAATGFAPSGAAVAAYVSSLLDTKAPVSGQFAVNTVATSGATQTLPVTHAAHRVTLSANCTFTFTAPTAGHAFILRLTGAFTPTFPASVKWPGGTAPTYASAGTLYHFVTLDAGTTWQGSGQAHA